MLDLETGEFLDTSSRQKLLQGLKIFSVPVLYAGKPEKSSKITDLIQQSNFISSGHIKELRLFCETNSLDESKAVQETDNTNLMEGLYIKLEEDGIVKERYKYIRSDFITTILNAKEHWLNRTIIPNKLEK